MSDLPFLVTGATGSQGGAVARALLDRGAAVRAVVRDPGSGRAVALEDRGVELVAGDLGDAASLTAAMAGVRGGFGLTTSGADEVAQGSAILEAAAASGLPHLVLASVASAAEAPEVPHFAAKAEVERRLQAAGLPATVVAPTFFFENLLGARNEIEAGRLPLALPPDRLLQAVALDDLGALVAEVLLHPDAWLGQRIEVAGDERTPAQIAAAFGDAVGRPVAHVAVPLADVAARSADLGAMYAFLADRGYHVDVAGLRAQFPQIGWHDLPSWAAAHLAPAGPDPAQVQQVRVSLLDLHRLLLEQQRRAAERIQGRMSASETLQAATEDLRFDWLRTLSEVLSELDAADAPGEQAAVLDRLRTLVVAPDESTGFGRRYLEALQHDPGVVFAHRDVVAALAG